MYSRCHPLPVGVSSCGSVRKGNPAWPSPQPGSIRKVTACGTCGCWIRMTARCSRTSSPGSAWSTPNRPNCRCCSRSSTSTRSGSKTRSASTRCRRSASTATRSSWRRARRGWRATRSSTARPAPTCSTTTSSPCGALGSPAHGGATQPRGRAGDPLPRHRLRPLCGTRLHRRRLPAHRRRHRGGRPHHRAAGAGRLPQPRRRHPPVQPAPVADAVPAHPGADGGGLRAA